MGRKEGRGEGLQHNKSSDFPSKINEGNSVANRISHYLLRLMKLLHCEIERSDSPFFHRLICLIWGGIYQFAIFKSGSISSVVKLPRLGSSLYRKNAGRFKSGK